MSKQKIFIIKDIKDVEGLKEDYYFVLSSIIATDIVDEYNEALFAKFNATAQKWHIPYNVLEHCVNYLLPVEAHVFSDEELKEHDKQMKKFGVEEALQMERDDDY